MSLKYLKLNLFVTFLRAKCALGEFGKNLRYVSEIYEEALDSLFLSFLHVI